MNESYSESFLARKPRSVDLTQVTEWDNGEIRRKEDYLAAEEPLEIRIGEDPLSVTMRTPGHDLELAAGFLFTEGLVQRREQIVALEALETDAETPRRIAGTWLQAKLVPESAPDFEKMRRHFFAASSCGICGKASIDSVRVANACARPTQIFASTPKFSSACRKCCGSRKPFSDAPAACTPRRFLMLPANCSFCGRTSAGTTQWTK